MSQRIENKMLRSNHFLLNKTNISLEKVPGKLSILKKSRKNLGSPIEKNLAMVKDRIKLFL